MLKDAQSGDYGIEGVRFGVDRAVDWMWTVSSSMSVNGCGPGVCLPLLPQRTLGTAECGGRRSLGGVLLKEWSCVINSTDSERIKKSMDKAKSRWILSSL
jgi:hypothetical protein